MKFSYFCLTQLCTVGWLKWTVGIYCVTDIRRSLYNIVSTDNLTVQSAVKSFIAFCQKIEGYLSQISQLQQS